MWADGHAAPEPLFCMEGNASQLCFDLLGPDGDVVKRISSTLQIQTVWAVD